MFFYRYLLRVFLKRVNGKFLLILLNSWKIFSQSKNFVKNKKTRSKKKKINPAIKIKSEEEKYAINRKDISRTYFDIF